MNQELINKIVKLISDKKNILKGTIIRTDNNIVDVKLVNNKIVRARLLEDTTDKEVNVVRDENNNYYAWNDKTKRVLLNQNHKFRKNRQHEEPEDKLISFYLVPKEQLDSYRFLVDIRFNDGKNDISLIVVHSDDIAWNVHGSGENYLSFLPPDSNYVYGLDYYIHNKNTIEVYIQYGAPNRSGLGHYEILPKRNNYQNSFHCYIVNGAIEQNTPNGFVDKFPINQEYTVDLGHYIMPEYDTESTPSYFVKPSSAIALLKPTPNYYFSSIERSDGKFYAKFNPTLNDSSDEFNNFVKYSKFYFENEEDLIEIGSYRSCGFPTLESESSYNSVTSWYIGRYETLRLSTDSVPYYVNLSYSSSLDNKTEKVTKIYPSIYKDKFYLVYVNKYDVENMSVTYDQTTQILSTTDTIRYKVYKFVDSGIDIFSVNPLPNYPFKIWKKSKVVKEGKIKGRSVQLRHIKHYYGEGYNTQYGAGRRDVITVSMDHINIHGGYYYLSTICQHFSIIVS